MNHLHHSSAYLIHVRPYRNTSALLDVLTATDGFLRMVANGIYGQRQQRQAWRGLLRPLQKIDISWRGDSSLKTLVEMEPGADKPVQPAPYVLYCGFYINELVQRCVLGQQADAAFFNAYERCVEALLAERDIQCALRQFEMALLHTLGCGVDFSCDAKGEAIRSADFYRFIPEQGFAVARADAQYAIEGADLLALLAGDYSRARTRAVAKYVLRQALSPHLGSEPLKSRRLFEPLST